MMRRRVVYSSFLLAALTLAPPAAFAQGDVAITNLDGQSRFTADQLDNLTGPVALYPDALLAQVLVAATFPDQVADAAAWVRTNGTSDLDNQSWDISVKAVAHYPSALNAMADKIDWTTALGQAYASQSSEVMQSVQRLRGMASANGNLNSTPQQQVITQGATYEIVPVQPSVIYVPVYDPYVVYARPIFNVGFSSRYWSFGVGFPIGAWLSYDCDWGLQRVYYNGWAPSYYAYSGNWRLRSRPYVRLTDIYVSPRYRTVYVNRTVTRHVVNYRNVDRYASVHRNTHFEGRYDNHGGSRGDVHHGNGNNNGNNNGRGNNDRPGNDRGGNDHFDNPNSNGGRTAQPRNGGPGQPNGVNQSPRTGNDGNRGASQPRANGGRTAVPQQRRNEPGVRTNGRTELVAPQGPANVPQAQPQAQPQPRQARPAAPQIQPQQRPQAQPQQRQAQPPMRPKMEPQRAAPQVSRPDRGARTAEPRGDRGRGGDGGGHRRGSL